MDDILNYFAYGSNMSLARIRARVPGCVFKGRAVLARHQLRFHKKGRDGSAKCDAFYTGDNEHVIHGVLFSLTTGERIVLDSYEGLGKGYERKQILLQQDSLSFSAFLYYATAIDARLQPFNWYKQHVITGAEEAGLPSAYINYLCSISSVNDPDVRRTAEQLAIYQTDILA
ncbi:hypothetical protein GCM10007941_37300 [Amphritea balenae]|nr:hypothetical protein GCM10007941_37300 [Amphritea balenae]